MPAFDQHTSQAAHNIEFLESFLLQRANDWAITVMFYTCVHIAEAMIFKKVVLLRQQGELTFPQHCSVHGERERTIKSIFTDYVDFHFNYTQLSKAAHDGRYKIYNYRNEVVKFHFDKYFIPIIENFNLLGIIPRSSASAFVFSYA